MNKKDKILAKTSGKTAILAAATAADAALFGGAPLLTTAISLSLGLYGVAAELRVERAVDFVHLIKENPAIFTADLVKTHEFQDAFVYTLEKYIRQRGDEKRKVIKRIFLGYAQAMDRERFELERLINIVSLISYDGLALLGILEKISLKSTSSKMLSELLKDYLVIDANNNLEKYQLKPGKNVREIWVDAEADLISIGLLRTYNIAKWGGENGYENYSDYDLSKLGKEIIKYIND